MALQVQISGAPLSKSIGSLNSSWAAKIPSVCCIISDQRREKSVTMGLMVMKTKNRGDNQRGLSCSTLETAEPAVGKVTAVDKDTFWPLVNAAGDKIVVLDMYTQWCGPCKIMAPKFEELSQKYSDVVFMKLDCNQENKPLAKELGIKVVPTFKIIKDSKIIKEVTGAKFENLVAEIEIARST